MAEAIRDWLRIVIPTSEPWLSKDDIRKGTRWSVELATILEETRFGIICLTPDNIDRPWVLFEAGALSKTLSNTYVCPFLFELQQGQIVGPLEQFQATIFEKEDLRNLVRNINNAQNDSALEGDVIDKLFELAWPEFEKKLLAITPVSLSEKHKRTTEEMVREILARIRADQRDSEVRESDFYRFRDSFMSFIIKLFKSGIPNTNQLPPEVAKDFEDWNASAHAFFEKKDISGCPDCLGTGWLIADDDNCARRCKHERLVIHKESLNEKANP